MRESVSLPTGSKDRLQLVLCIHGLCICGLKIFERKGCVYLKHLGYFSCYYSSHNTVIIYYVMCILYYILLHNIVAILNYLHSIYMC
jgi:hypothetical protein